MSKGIARDLNEGFTLAEEMIVKAFISGKSIRELSSKPIIEGDSETKFGRTAIKNILIAYAIANPEYKDEIDSRLFKNKTHKTEVVELKELTNNDVMSAYEQIMAGEKTLTELSLEFGRTRDYIKDKILQILSDDEIKAFNEDLKGNQNANRDKFYIEFEALSEDEKKEIIFEKINNRRKKSDKAPYNIQFLERKLSRVKQYFLEKRNQKIQDSRNLFNF